MQGLGANVLNIFVAVIYTVAKCYSFKGCIMQVFAVSKSVHPWKAFPFKSNINQGWSLPSWIPFYVVHSS